MVTERKNILGILWWETLKEVPCMQKELQGEPLGNTVPNDILLLHLRTDLMVFCVHRNQSFLCQAIFIIFISYAVKCFNKILNENSLK